MNVKNISIFLVSGFILMTLNSCKSLVTIDDVRKQEDKALSAVEDAREESVELAELKVQYSEDRVKAEVEKLEDEQKMLEKDLKKLKGISTESAVGTTEGTVKNLEKRNKEIEKEIKDLKAQKTENWEESIEHIRELTRSLQTEISNITANLK